MKLKNRIKYFFTYFSFYPVNIWGDDWKEVSLSQEEEGAWMRIVKRFYSEVS